ncbi:MAG: hypothetical protein MUE87_01840 [Methanothrix sp.]|nr:hypothetical protein [Methanothrix sp.]
MLLERIVSPGLAHNSYLVGDRAVTVVIDPRRDVDVYIDLAHRAGLRIGHILETHRNEDYFVGSMELAERTGAEVWHADAEMDYKYCCAIHQECPGFSSQATPYSRETLAEWISWEEMVLQRMRDCFMIASGRGSCL